MSLPEIWGFQHEGRGVGIRQHQLILPSVVCSTVVSRRIAQEVGGITFAHQHGCAIIGVDVSGIDDFFIALASHPNVGSVLVVGLGCETTQGNELTEKITKLTKSTEYLVIQESGGVEGTVATGAAAARELAINYSHFPYPLEELVVGIELSRDFEIEPLLTELTHIGIKYVIISEAGGSAKHFSMLMSQKVQLIISFPDVNQPPSGFPLIPVLNVASNSALHQAISGEFDLQFEATAKDMVDKIISTADHTKTISEQNQSGEILVPRLVRSV